MQTDGYKLYHTSAPRKREKMCREFCVEFEGEVGWEDGGSGGCFQNIPDGSLLQLRS